MTNGINPVDLLLSNVCIHVGNPAPSNAFAAISHRGSWPWIDQDDVDTIELISFVMLLPNVVDTANSTQLRTITIPSN